MGTRDSHCGTGADCEVANPRVGEGERGTGAGREVATPRMDEGDRGTMAAREVANHRASTPLLEILPGAVRGSLNITVVQRGAYNFQTGVNNFQRGTQIFIAGARSFL